MPLTEIARDLELAPSSAAAHVVVLEEAGLLLSTLRPAKRGLQKVCWRTCDAIHIELPRGGPDRPPSVELSAAVGSYVDAVAAPPCGLAGATELIGLVDDPQTFLDPDRHAAQLLWLGAGHVEYRLPNRVPRGARIDVLELSAEVGSQTSGAGADWPSDISVWVDGVHLGAWTSPGEAGRSAGRRTPEWWTGSPFGALKRWRVTAEGTFIDGERLSSVTVAELGLEPRTPIAVRIGVDPAALNAGGMTLFGAAFGNYPQDVQARIEYTPAARRRRA